VTVTSAGDKGSEVIIVANETNKTQINESSTDDDQYQLLDSLEYSAETQDRPINIVKGKKLDESEVLIVSPSFINIDDGDGYVYVSTLLLTPSFTSWSLLHPLFLFFYPHALFFHFFAVILDLTCFTYYLYTILFLIQTKKQTLWALVRKQTILT
jgi:hypothetical protein